MSEDPVPYSHHPEESPIGYMPLPQVYAALDFVLALARNEASPPLAAAGKSFLRPWYSAGGMPSDSQIDQARAQLSEQIRALTDAFEATLRGFVADFDNHPCPLPGTPFGGYYRDLIELFEAAPDAALAADNPAGE